jgi:hypothetical protein
VVVVPPLGGRLDDVELSSKTTWAWPQADAERVWLMGTATSAVELGDRMRCRDIRDIEIRNERFSRPRRPISEVLYAPFGEERFGELEPYCLGARVPGAAGEAR